MTLLATDFPRRTGADVSVVAAAQAAVRALAQAPLSARAMVHDEEVSFLRRAATVPGSCWTPAMARLAWELLTGSCRQLRIGFAGQLPEPPRADGDGHADARRAERDALQGAPKLARLGPDGFVVAFPYDAAMNAQVKALPADQRRWADGAWQVSTSQAEVVARLVSGRHFAISATAHHLLEQAIGQPISAALPTSTSAPVARAGAPNHSALVRMVDGAFEVVLPEGDKELATEFRSAVLGVRFDQASGSRRVPRGSGAALAKFAHRRAWTIDPSAERALTEDLSIWNASVAKSRAVVGSIAVPGLNPEITLRSFQAAGVSYLVEKRRSFNGDDVGGGKSVESLATVAVTNTLPLLIVCQSSLKSNWKNEVHQDFPAWMPFMVDGRAEVDIPPVDVVIINYDILADHLDALGAYGFKSLIVDESHRVKTFGGKSLIEYRKQRDSQSTLSTALGALAASKALPLLVTCQAKIKGFWEEWLRVNRPQWKVGQVGQLDERPDVVVVGTDVLPSAKRALGGYGFKTVLADESRRYAIEGDRPVTLHTAAKVKAFFANKKFGKGRAVPDSLRTAATKAASKPLVEANGVVLLLTATPAPNGLPRELFPQLQVMGRDVDFGTWERYADRYCALFDEAGRRVTQRVAHQDKEVTDGFGTTETLMELHEWLRAICYLHRSKAEMMPDMPPYEVEELVLPLDEKLEKQYREAEEDIVEFLAKRAAEEATAAGEDASWAARRARFKARAGGKLTELAALRRLASQAKLPALFEWIEGFLRDTATKDEFGSTVDDGTGEKIIIFAHYQEIQQALIDHLGSVFLLATGKQNRADADAAKERFQTDPTCRVIVCSSQGAKEGHTLTAAQTVLVADLPDVPTDLHQQVGRCIAQGQPVLTDRGLLAIEHVKPGDRVLTHTGSWKPVREVLSNGTREVVEVAYTRHDEPLRCTPDHQLWVLDSITGTTSWKAAGTLSESDFLGLPRSHGSGLDTMAIPDEVRNQSSRPCIGCGRPEVPLVTHGLCERCRGLWLRKKRPFPVDYVRGQRGQGLPTDVKLTSELLWALGMWLGDGWLSRDGERGVYHKVGLCGHASERAEVEKALGFIAEAFNVSCGPVTVRENTCQGLIYNVQVARLFEKWFFASPPAHKPKDSTSGKGVQAKVKRLAPWMWDLNDEQAWALLHGLAASDGDWRPDGSSRFHLTSPHLIYSLAVLAARMGYEPNIRVLLDPGKRGGTSQVSQRRSKAWEVMWQRAEQSVRRRYDLRLSDNLYVWHPVRYVKPASVPTPVYDLAVEDDHSFTVGLIAVHNCWGRMNDPHGAHLVLAQGEGTIDVPNRRRLGKKQEVVNILIEGASAGGLGVPTGAKGARSMQEDLLADLAEMEHTIRRAQDPSSWPDPARLRLARDEQVGWLVPGFGAVVFNDDGEKVASFTSIEDLARDGWVIA